MSAWAMAAMLLAAPAGEAGPDARARAEELAARAAMLQADGDLAAATTTLERAVELDPSPFYFYGLGVLARMQGDCPRAVARFETVLQLLPDTDLDPRAREQTIEDTRAEIERCGASVEEARPAPVAEPVVPPPAKPATAVDREPSGEAPPRPWSRDPAGVALLASGSVVAAVGVGLIVGAAVLDADAERSATATEFVDVSRRARTLGAAGFATLGAGGMLLVGATVRFVVVSRRGSRRVAFAMPALRQGQLASSP